MDNFLKGSRIKHQDRTKKVSSESSAVVKRKVQDFLTTASTALEDKNRDVGLDMIGDMKNSVENVKQFFNIVRELDNVKGELQQLQFSENFPETEYRLIEVDSRLADEFENGQKLVFRGMLDDYAVLCTETHSYSAKEVETSNSMLLVPSLNTDDDVLDPVEKCLKIRKVIEMTHHYLELKEIENVSIYRLREMLRKNELGWDWETEDSENIYELTDLLNNVQMSNGQMIDILSCMPVVEHKGCIRWLSCEIRDNLLNEIVEMCDDNAVDTICVEATSFEALRSHLPQNITDGIIRWFLRTHCEVNSEEEPYYRILSRPIVRGRASQLLRTAIGFDLTTFEKLIDQMLPVGIKLDYSFLDGLCLIEETVKGKYISYLNIEDLPEDPRERMKLLFERKQSWLMSEIAPFLADIFRCTKGMSGFLVSQCYSTKDDTGEKVLCGLRAV